MNDEFDERPDFKAKNFATWKSLPFVGKHYYWGTPFTGDFGGGGVDAQERKAHKMESKEYREYAEKLYSPESASDRKSFDEWYAKLDDARKGEFAVYAQRWFSKNKAKPEMVRRLQSR
jgi:hypothetical protein